MNKSSSIFNEQYLNVQERIKKIKKIERKHPRLNQNLNLLDLSAPADSEIIKALLDYQNNLQDLSLAILLMNQTSDYLNINWDLASLKVFKNNFKKLEIEYYQKYSNSNHTAFLEHCIYTQGKFYKSTGQGVSELFFVYTEPDYLINIAPYLNEHALNILIPEQIKKIAWIQSLKDSNRIVKTNPSLHRHLEVFSPGGYIIFKRISQDLNLQKPEGGVRKVIAISILRQFDPHANEDKIFKPYLTLKEYCDFLEKEFNFKIKDKTMLGKTSERHKIAAQKSFDRIKKETTE